METRWLPFKPESPKRLYGLGWHQVRDLRPYKGYQGSSLLDFDQFARIHLSDDQTGVAICHYPDSRSEVLGDENCARLLRAIEDARVAARIAPQLMRQETQCQFRKTVLRIQ